MVACDSEVIEFTEHGVSSKLRAAERREAKSIDKVRQTRRNDLVGGDVRFDVAQSFHGVDQILHTERENSALGEK